MRASIARMRSQGLSTAAPHGGVEDAAARDLEVGEARAVEDLRDPQHLAGRQLARERVLREQADGRVDDLRQLRDLTAPG